MNDQHSSTKLTGLDVNSLGNIMKKLNKMSVMMTELKRNIKMEVFLTKNLIDVLNDSKTSSTNLLIRVENYEEGTVYYWNTETFRNRYDMMKELFDKFKDDDFDIFNLKSEDDPVWDEPKPSLLGYTFYKLEPLSFLMSNPTDSQIISPHGLCMGILKIDIVPHDDDNLEFDEMPEDPLELIGQPLNFRVELKEISDLPNNFCKGVHIEYTSFHDNLTYKTKVVEEKMRNIALNESFEHHIDHLTKEDIEFLVKEKMCFKIYAYEEVEKKGKIKRESLCVKDSTGEMPNESSFEGSSAESKYSLKKRSK